MPRRFFASFFSTACQYGTRHWPLVDLFALVWDSQHPIAVERSLVGMGCHVVHEGAGSNAVSEQGHRIPPSGVLLSIPTFGVEEKATAIPRIMSPRPFSFDGERSPSRSSSNSTQNPHASPPSNPSANCPQNGFPTASLLKRQSGSRFQSATSTSNFSSQVHARTITGPGTGSSGVGSYISRPRDRLGLVPPQRPAPDTAAPPGPEERESRNPSPKLSHASPPIPTKMLP